MDFTWMPSLKHIALVKVTAELWNPCDIRDLVARPVSTIDILIGDICSCREWQVAEDKIKEKVSELPLPESLKKKILDIMRPIGLQIYEWKRYVCKNLSLDILLMTAEESTKWLSVPCWTRQGTVDKKKVAKTLVRDDNLDISKRYVLACNFCLEDDIKVLWNSLPERMKEDFYNERHPSFCTSDRILTVLWTYDVKGELTKLNGLIKYKTGREISAYRFAFEIAALDANKTAAEYFLQKLTSLEREESLVWYAYSELYDDEVDPDTLCFLLSQMNEEQQVKLFETSPYEVLICLLDWPWQSFFMEAANRTWDFLPERHYVYIKEKIVDKMRLGYKDWNYHKLFVQFWEQCQSTFRKYVICDCVENRHSGFLLRKLLELEDKEIVRLILKNATVEEREKIIFSREGKNTCCFLVLSDRFDLLSFFVQECLSSEDMMIKFREKIVSYINFILEDASVSEKYITKFCQVIDDLITKS